MSFWTHHTLQCGTLTGKVSILLLLLNSRTYKNSLGSLIYFIIKTRVKSWECTVNGTKTMCYDEIYDYKNCEKGDLTKNSKD